MATNFDARENVLPTWPPVTLTGKFIYIQLKNDDTNRHTIENLLTNLGAIVLKELPQKESETHLYYIKDEDSVFENECVAPTLLVNSAAVIRRSSLRCSSWAAYQPPPIRLVSEPESNRNIYKNITIVQSNDCVPVLEEMLRMHNRNKPSSDIGALVNHLNECCVCLNQFDALDRFPMRVVACDHTSFCRDCLQQQKIRMCLAQGCSSQFVFPALPATPVYKQVMPDRKRIEIIELIGKAESGDKSKSAEIMRLKSLLGDANVSLEDNEIPTSSSCSRHPEHLVSCFCDTCQTFACSMCIRIVDGCCYTHSAVSFKRIIDIFVDKVGIALGRVEERGRQLARLQSSDYEKLNYLDVYLKNSTHNVRLYFDSLHEAVEKSADHFTTILAEKTSLLANPILRNHKLIFDACVAMEDVSKESRKMTAKALGSEETTSINMSIDSESLCVIKSPESQLTAHSGETSDISKLTALDTTSCDVLNMTVLESGSAKLKQASFGPINEAELVVRRVSNLSDILSKLLEKLKGFAELTSCDLQIPIGAFKFGTNAVEKFCSDFELFHRGDMLQAGKVIVADPRFPISNLHLAPVEQDLPTFRRAVMPTLASTSQPSIETVLLISGALRELNSECDQTSQECHLESSISSLSAIRKKYESCSALIRDLHYLQSRLVALHFEALGDVSVAINTSLLDICGLTSLIDVAVQHLENCSRRPNQSTTNSSANVSSNTTNRKRTFTQHSVTKPLAALAVNRNRRPPGVNPASAQQHHTVPSPSDASEQQTNTSILLQKFCDVHQSKTHNTDECLLVSRNPDMTIKELRQQYNTTKPPRNPRPTNEPLGRQWLPCSDPQVQNLPLRRGSIYRGRSRGQHNPSSG